MSQYLGDISAYALAVSQGYTGTEEEYAELMASYATVGQTAVAAAQTATTKASEAATSATTATNKATEATTAATTATNKAAEAQADADAAALDASQALSAASTATTKATEATTAAATAVSAKDDAVSANTAAQSAKTAAQTAQTGAETAAASVSASAAQIATNTSDISELKEDLTHAFPHDTVSGAVASFADGADDVPMDSVIVSIEPVQSGSGDPSPDNVRPISGHTQAVVTRTGVNVWDEEWEVGGYAGSTGAAWDTNTRIRSKTTNYISVLPNTTYYVSMPSGTNMYLDVMFYNAGKTFISNANPNAGTTFTTPSDARFMRFATGVNYGTTYNHDISINYPATDTDYHEGHVQSITIDLGQTVYGGKLDVTNGVLTTYPYYARYNGETLTGAWISDRDKYVSGTTPTTGAQVVNIGGAGTDVQLTPHEVRSLLGSNNVWADTGDSTVEYRADPTLYIGRLTEPDADMVADANITSDSYFMVGNTLYKATANIASGATIVPNVNCTRKSLSEALNEINA